MAAKMLLTVVALLLMVSTCLAEGDLADDFKRKATKADLAELEANCTKLTACAAYLRLMAAEREQSWRVHAPKLEDLASRRFAARADAAKLAELDAELATLLREVAEWAPENTDSAKRDHYKDWLSRFNGPNVLLLTTRDALRVREDELGADHPDIEAMWTRLNDFELAFGAESSRRQLEGFYERACEDGEVLRKSKREYRKALAAKDDAEAARCLWSVQMMQARLDSLRDAIRAEQARIENPDAPFWRPLAYSDADQLVSVTHIYARIANARSLTTLAAASAVTHLELIVTKDEFSKDLPSLAEVFATVTKLASLKVLRVSLQGVSFEHKDLQSLAQLKGLEELSLEASRWTDPACITALSALKGCRVRLGGSLGKASVAGHLKQLSGVKELALEFTDWPTEKGLGEALGSLPNLVSVSALPESEVAAALKAKSLHTVRAAALDAPLVTAIKANPSITTLDLSDSIISADELVQSDLKQLKHLVLSGCVELDEFALPALRKLTHLQSIDLTATPIPVWVVRLLQQLNPDVKVRY